MSRFIADAWRPAAQIAVLFLLFYGILSLFKGTRASGILRGLTLAGVVIYFGVLGITQWLQLHELTRLLEILLGGLAIVAVILFAPELRRAMTRLAESPVFLRFMKSRPPDWIEEVASAVERLASRRIGALIAIEREIGLREFMESGARLDSELRATMIETIFYPGTPLHDGAVVIQNDRIAAAACMFPLSDNPDVDPALGTRHRAALGITEETDAVAVIVSEETGIISLAVKGRLLRNLDRERLIKVLRERTGREPPPESGLRRSLNWIGERISRRTTRRTVVGPDGAPKEEPAATLPPEKKP